MSKQVLSRVLFATLIGLALVPLLVALLVAVGEPVQAAPFGQADRDTLTVTTVARNVGTEMSLLSASANGHRFANEGRTFLVVQNDYTGTITATIDTPLTFEGLAVADLTVPVTASTVLFIGPFPTSVYNQSGTVTDTGKVWLDFSEATSVTVGAFMLWR